LSERARCVLEELGFRPRANRRSRAGEGPLVANVGPQPAGLGLTGAWRQHRHRRVVDMQGCRTTSLLQQARRSVLQRRRRCRPSWTKSRSPGSRPRGRRSQLAGRAASDRRTWRPRYGPRARHRRDHRQSRDQAPSATTISQARQESFARTCRINLNRPAGNRAFQ